MAITYGTLAQEVDGKISYVYPKTDSKIVEYTESESVKDKLDALTEDIGKVNARVTNIVENTELGSGGGGSVDSGIANELINIRIPNYNLVPEGTTYDTAGNAVRGQFQEVIKLLANKVTAEYVDTAIENSIGVILQSDY